MPTITWLRKLRRNKRGFSTVIAVVLSLVILVVIVANVILWNYSMSQLDWERDKEDVRISNVTRIADSSWFTTQSEYTVNLGRCTGGSYTDTRQVDGAFETFVEAANVQRSYLRRTDLAGVTPLGKLMNFTQPPVGQAETSYGIGRSASVYFYTPPLNAGSAANGTWTLYLWSSTVSSGKTSQLTVRIHVVSSDGLVEKATIGIVTNIVVDYGFIERVITVSGSAVSIAAGDRIRLTLYAQTGAGNDSQGMLFYYDGYGAYETLGHETRLQPPVQSGNRLDFMGTFVVDLVAYPLDRIESIEMRLVYRANETGERWYLKAYNWTSGVYSDASFNNTLGHVPSLAWSTYAVDVAEWRSYLNAGGGVSLKLTDNQTDVDCTRIEVDFLAIRVTTSGARFTFQNRGALTSHLVSLWVNNATQHERFDLNLFINSGSVTSYVRDDIQLSENAFVKVVTARGNVATYTVE